MDDTYMTRLIDSMETFMPMVRMMRPAKRGTKWRLR